MEFMHVESRNTCAHFVAHVYDALAHYIAYDNKMYILHIKSLYIYTYTHAWLYLETYNTTKTVCSVK